MMKFLLTLAFVLLLTSLVALIANLPGTVSIALPGHMVDMQLTVLLGAVLALVLVALLTLAAGHWLWHVPNHCSARGLRQKSQRRGCGISRRFDGAGARRCESSR